MPCPFSDYSDAVAACARAAAPSVVGLEWGGRQQISAIRWLDGVIVTSEQSLPEAGSYMAILPGGARMPATRLGRDSGTNVAALRVNEVARAAPDAALEVAPGQSVLALGSDGNGGPRVRKGGVEAVGPAWQSQCGGRIDQLITLDIRLDRTAEGGPVFDAAGRLIGMSTFGPRQQVLVIPTATIARVAAQLAAHGRVARGWLGVGVQPVAIPGETEGASPADTGLMVLSLAEGSPAAGCLLPGDILISANGTRLSTPRALTALLSAEAIGSTLALRLLRGGVVQQTDIGVIGRPA